MKKIAIVLLCFILIMNITACNVSDKQIQNDIEKDKNVDSVEFDSSDYSVKFYIDDTELETYRTACESVRTDILGTEVCGTLKPIDYTQINSLPSYDNVDSIEVETEGISENSIEYTVFKINEGLDNEKLLDFPIAYSDGALDIPNLIGQFIIRAHVIFGDKKSYDSYDYYFKTHKIIDEDTKGYINIIGVDSGFTIPIDDNTAEKLVSELKQANDTINPKKAYGTDNQVYRNGINLWLDNMDYDEYGVNLFYNDNGVKAIGEYKDDCPISETVYDEIISIVQANTDWHQIKQSKIKDIVHAELAYADRFVAEITDQEKLDELEIMLSSAEKLEGNTACPFGITLRLLTAFDQEIELRLADDSCSVFVLGSSDYYRYYHSSSAQTAQEIMLNLFGIKNIEQLYALHE